MIFIVVIAHHAFLGRSWAIAATLFIALAIPRPLMLPIVASLLWVHRGLIVPFGLAGVASILFAHVTGHLDRWIEVTVSSTSELAVTYNVGPSAIIGSMWIPIGVAAAAVLMWRGRPGWASLAISPYWLPYYLLVGILELVPRRQFERHEVQASVTRRPAGRTTLAADD